jgi:Asp-tRNA(Asn)/Glu-tRNA(Gln) amidotransferase A subunit family amidase
MSYDLKPIKAPRLAGISLKIAAKLAENPTTAKMLSSKLLGDAGILALRDLDTDEPLPAQHPLFEHYASPPSEAAEAISLDALVEAGNNPNAGFQFASVGDYARAYRDGRLTPEAVAEQVLARTAASETLDPPMRVFIAQQADDVMAQARNSGERMRNGKALGPLDGVPVAVKDELDQTPYPTTVGTRFLGTEACEQDAEVVKRLRQAGALLIGKANMHEIGLGVTGINPHHGTARNPYNPNHATGGSSSGPAAAVAMGLCPMAVGADGGGSIRIPSAFNGIVGLKGTYGRFSEHGAAPLCWSVAHVGPVGATARDVALGYLLMAGPDPKDPNTRHQPPVHLNHWKNGVLKGLKLGVFKAWFEDAEPDVVEQCTRFVDQCVENGAEIVPIELPELGVMATVHLVTICTEMTAAFIRIYEEHQSDYSWETRIGIALARQMQGYDYVHAQRHRARLCRNFYKVLEAVDCIVTPTTGCTAPVLNKDAFKTGESNLTVVAEIMRFAQPANLTGLPAITFPVGYDSAGLPVGIQFMGRPWAEHTLLRVAMAADSMVTRQKPQIHLSPML